MYVFSQVNKSRQGTMALVVKLGLVKNNFFLSAYVFKSWLKPIKEIKGNHKLCEIAVQYG